MPVRIILCGTDWNINPDYIEIATKETEKFNSFTFRNPTCSCLYYFNKFLSEFGASQVLLEQKEGIKVYVAKVRNFKFYYAYSIQNWFYKVSINTIKKNTTSRFQFGLWGEIELFSVIKINENWKVTKITISSEQKNNEFGVRNCPGEFPRF